MPLPPTPTPAAKDDESEESAGDSDAETTSATENLGTRYTASDEYPNGETDWKMSESSVYPNLSGADEDQIQMLIDALLTFAPLPELETGLKDGGFSDADRTALRGVMAERYLVAEDFANAKRFLTDAEALKRVDRLESLTKEATGNGAEKADKMAALGDAWADARGMLLRQPLQTRISIFDRQWNYDPLTKRDNGVAIRHSAVEDQLDDLTNCTTPPDGGCARRDWRQRLRWLRSAGSKRSSRFRRLPALPCTAKRVLERSASPKSRAKFTTNFSRKHRRRRKPTRRPTGACLRFPSPRSTIRGGQMSRFAIHGPTRAAMIPHHAATSSQMATLSRKWPRWIRAGMISGTTVRKMLKTG